MTSCSGNSEQTSTSSISAPLDGTSTSVLSETPTSTIPPSIENLLNTSCANLASVSSFDALLQWGFQIDTEVSKQGLSTTEFRDRFFDDCSGSKAKIEASVSSAFRSTGGDPNKMAELGEKIDQIREMFGL